MLKKWTKFLIAGLGIFFFLFIGLIYFYLTIPGEIVKLPPPVEVQLEIYNNKIEPQNFRVKAGQDIKLIIVSMEGKHSIGFEDEKLFWVGGDFDEPGETLEIVFAAPREPGQYRFFCTEEGHREKGEEGTMIVE